ncbi:MAG: molybdopterin-dependent oxidoreductase [Gemmatimonadales bacterium]
MLPMSRLRFALLAATIMPGALVAQAGAAVVTLVGEGGVEKELSASELAALPQVEVRGQGRDSSSHLYRGPTVRALMTLVGAPTGRALRGPNMLLAVLAEATDGYKVAYMLAELDEQFGATEAIPALTQDGAPLPAQDGPCRIVVSGGMHHARWIRQVERLRLVRVRP